MELALFLPSPALSYPAQLKMGNVSSFPKGILGVALEIFVPSWVLFRNKIQPPETIIK